MSDSKTIQLTISTTTTTEATHTIELDARQIRELLRESGVEVPPNAVIVVQVPGGANWSGMDLDIGVDANVEVRWETKDTATS